jgi:hypothetical protein
MLEAPEPVQVYDEETPEDQGMRNQAESLHIFDQGVRTFMDAPRILATRMEESRTQTAHIDPNTGHIFDPDVAAAHHATGPDRADPPPGDAGGGGRGGGGGHPCGPGGGRGSGGGGGGGGGGPPGAGGGPNHHSQDKLFGQHPNTFTGDRLKT